MFRLLINRDLAAIVKARRPIWMALAHEIVRAKIGTPRMELLNRIYIRLQQADKTRCQAELAECKAARRGQRLAQVYGGGL